MTESLVEIARQIARAPWNRPGTDKTWGLDAMAQALRFQRDVRQPRRVERGRSRASDDPTRPV